MNLNSQEPSDLGKGFKKRFHDSETVTEKIKVNC